MFTQIQKKFVLHPLRSACFNPRQPARIALNLPPNLVTDSLALPVTSGHVCNTCDLSFFVFRVVECTVNVRVDIKSVKSMWNLKI